jgi:hypothetical protein
MLKLNLPKIECVLHYSKMCHLTSCNWLVQTTATTSHRLIGMRFSLCCLIMSFWVPCRDVHYDFHIKTMLGPSLPPVICRRVRVLFTLFVGYKTYLINVGDYRRCNKKWTIQRNWQHSVHKSQDEDKQSTKTRHNMCWTPLYASKHK